ncbi:hypothetical protein SAMD00023353_0203200 [Rosellinia necatrix]|uniref:Uncharacterized protein n=1 Tax=Rosellinia necatrix TaxID=77044 RepID=A0A1S7UJB6_ROSNE|nr:hypothetical protein SAMD00023353_0203200 [Rosellinia necatrix]
METLRKLADLPPDIFDASWSIITKERRNYIYARSFASERPTILQDLAIQEAESIDKLAELDEQASSNSDVTANLILALVNRGRDDNILATRVLFMKVFKKFGIDSRFYQLIKTNRHGLHYDWDGPRVSYYVGTALYTLMWSFDKETRKTRVILISRDLHGTNASDSLRLFLDREAHRLHSPFLLAWVSLVHITEWMDSSTYDLLTNIRRLEGLTGYGPYGGERPRTDVSIAELTDASKRIGHIQVNVANQIRHIAIGTAIPSHIASVTAEPSIYATEPYVSKCEQELANFSSTTPSLQRSLDDSNAYAYYLRERIGSQNTVVYALMGQIDARTTIDLARASKEIAEAAKRDSSAMKAIAIVARTYFAALWAVPSPGWDQPDVIQPKFWLYWAFTVPSTILIFALWFGLTTWGVPWQHKQKPQKRDVEYEELNVTSKPPMPTALDRDIDLRDKKTWTPSSALLPIRNSNGPKR